MNNPLNATDPSGFFLKSLWNEIRPFVGAIVGVVLAYFCQGCGYAAYAAIGGVSGAVGAAANGGNILQGMALGALSGFAYSVAGWAGGAIAGGFSAAVTGGDVASAFASGAIGGLAGGGEGMSGLIIASIAGGVTSEITGGKFANGASSAAFMWAVRAGMSSGKPRSSNPPEYDIETDFNPDATLGDDVGAVDEPEFSDYAQKESEVPYHEEVLVVGHRKTYAPVSFNLNMTGRYMHAQAQRNAHNAAIQAQSLRIAEARSWDKVVTAVNVVAGGSVAMLCGGAMTICANMAAGAGGSAGFDYFSGTSPTPGSLIEGAAIGGLTGPLGSRLISLSGGSVPASAVWRHNEFWLGAAAGAAIPNF